MNASVFIFEYKLSLNVGFENRIGNKTFVKNKIH